MNKKSLVFWIAICCGLIGVVQTLCNKFGVDLPTNVLIDCVSIVLCVLCCFGILKNDTGHSDSEIKDIIVDKLTSSKGEEDVLNEQNDDKDVKSDTSKRLRKDNENLTINKKKIKKTATSKSLKNSGEVINSKDVVEMKEDI